MMRRLEGSGGAALIFSGGPQVLLATRHRPSLGRVVNRDTQQRFAQVEFILIKASFALHVSRSLPSYHSGNY